MATLLYTSGTAGKPKGVMLSHGNLLYQVRMICAVIQPHPGSRVLSILPTWHAYERAGEYFLLSQGEHPLNPSIIQHLNASVVQATLSPIHTADRYCDR